MYYGDHCSRGSPTKISPCIWCCVYCHRACAATTPWFSSLCASQTSDRRPTCTSDYYLPPSNRRTEKERESQLVKIQADLDRFEQMENTERARSGKAKPDVTQAATWQGQPEAQAKQPLAARCTCPPRPLSRTWA